MAAAESFVDDILEVGAGKGGVPEMGSTAVRTASLSIPTLQAVAGLFRLHVN